MSEQERIAALTRALKELADELETWVAMYYADTRKYPCENRRYNRDIEPVRRARALLSLPTTEPAKAEEVQTERIARALCILNGIEECQRAGCTFDTCDDWKSFEEDAAYITRIIAAHPTTEPAKAEEQ